MGKRPYPSPFLMYSQGKNRPSSTSIAHSELAQCYLAADSTNLHGTPRMPVIGQMIEENPGEEQPWAATGAGALRFRLQSGRAVRAASEPGRRQDLLR